MLRSAFLSDGPAQPGREHPAPQDRRGTRARRYRGRGPNLFGPTLGKLPGAPVRRGDPIPRR